MAEPGACSAGQAHPPDRLRAWYELVEQMVAGARLSSGRGGGPRQLGECWLCE